MRKPKPSYLCPKARTCEDGRREEYTCRHAVSHLRHSDCRDTLSTCPACVEWLIVEVKDEVRLEEI